MATTSIFSIILLLLCIQISFLPLATASEGPEFIERQNSDPFYTPDVVDSQSEELQIIPGITKHLLIKLQGQEEEITFSFHPDEADPNTFETLVLVNKKIEASHVASFPNQETLNVNLDYEAEKCIISGDKGFSLSSAIHEKQYKLDIIHDKGAGYQEHIVNPTNTAADDINRTFVISATAGACGLTVVALKIALSLRRKKKSIILGDLPARCATEEDLSKKSNLTQGDCEGEDNNYTGKGYVDSLTEVPFKTNSSEVEKAPPKKISPKSQVSTAATLSAIAPIALFKKGKANTHVKFTDEDVSEVVETERKTCVKKPCALTKTKPEIKKQPFKEDKDNNDTVELSLDLDCCDGDRDPRRAPTVREIRALVKKMEAEGTIGYECDPSAESDDEDQYEAPILPNYFCCMLCFQGKRCTIVQPCRHIFSCTDCVEDLLKTYKICVLCANEITGYEPL